MPLKNDDFLLKSGRLYYNMRYGNACGCAAQPYPQCCSDHCDTVECFAGDVNATLAYGFDSCKHHRNRVSSGVICEYIPALD